MKRLMIIALLLAFLELPALAKMTLYTTDDVNLREGPGQKYAKMDRAGCRAPLRPAAVRTSGHRCALNERGFARGKAFHGICIIDIMYLHPGRRWRRMRASPPFRTPSRTVSNRQS